jgi:hypothetical protein
MYLVYECAAKGVESVSNYSIENNSVGEAALVALEEIGEESVSGLFCESN